MRIEQQHTQTEKHAHTYTHTWVHLIELGFTGNRQKTGIDEQQE